LPEEESITAEDWEGWAKKVPATDADYRAYWFWRGKCVLCHKGDQEACCNPFMPNVKTHCYRCYLIIEKANKSDKK
jgi:hypothetical protein